MSLIQHSDTGESGETYDIDVQTLPWSRFRYPAILMFPLGALFKRMDDSESGETYEAEILASHGNEAEALSG